MSDYNLMCEKAFSYLGIPKNQCGQCDMGRSYDEGHIPFMFPIYTQKQLQEMMMETLNMGSYVLKDRFASILKNSLFHDFDDDFNIVWLRYAMWMMHGKHWSDDKEDWE